MGLEVQEGVGGTGVVGLLRGGPGPCVGVRVDIDALPVTEATGAAYASLEPGVMHACGHDAHITCGLGAARILAPLAQELRGSIKFIFQPSEEIVSGAMRMIEDGVLEHPPLERCVGFHVSALYPAPTLCFSHGPKMAGTNSFTITVRGRSGHAGYPHLTVDRIIAAQIVLALQTIDVEQDPAHRARRPDHRRHPRKRKVQHHRRGGGHGGTMRFFRGDLRDAMVAGADRIVQGVLDSMGGSAEDRLRPGTPHSSAMTVLPT